MAAVNRAVGITIGDQMVAASGTREALTAADTFTKSVIIQAKRLAADNTENVFIGDTNLVEGTTEGIELTPGQSLSIDANLGEVLNLKLIFVDAVTNDDGVVFLYTALPA